MKLITLFSFFAISAATSATSESIDVSTLSEYEKQVHRIAYCEQLDTFIMDKDLPNLKRESDIFEIYSLLSSNNFFEKDARRIRFKISNDLKTKMILEEFSSSQSDVNSCLNDLKSILKKEYVSNFLYMDN